MIYNWDIISHLDNTTGNQLFTLVVDGSERDTRLITKKLEGYVQEPVRAEEPFSYAFALPPNLDEETLEKIRTAVREAIDQSHKVNQFSGEGMLGNPLFTARTPLDDPFFDLSQATFTATQSFFHGVEDGAASDTTRKASNATAPAELTITDKDMLIKDMEDTLLGKMPLDEILTENTKFEIYKNVENKELSAASQQQREQKLEEAAKDKDSLEDTLNALEHKMDNPDVDLEELQTVTNTITEKDLGFVRHANTNPHLAYPADNSAPAGKTTTQLPEEVALGNTIPPVEGQPSDLPEITVRVQDRAALEKTFNLETTLSTEIMRTQYEKSFHTISPTTERTASKTVIHPAQMMLQASDAGDTSGHTQPMHKPGEPRMEEHSEEKTFFRIRRKQQLASTPVPPAPKAPAAPTAPVPPVPAAPHPAGPSSSPVRELVSDSDAEKTKTIDHSIELPLSELKKHNWPLEVPLLPTYTLENMVLSVNRFAHATAISVIENPGKLYNPLVFHGTTGTGKTHFLNAMAYGFSKKYGQENIFMTNGVRFSRGIQRYVMEGNIEKFEKFMQSVKVLLIDDIHLLAINEQNRAYISKILHAFLKEQKQIVITSKYPPESLEKLEDLINFRLDSGWISELKSPSGDSHFKIVKKMLLNNGVDLSDSQILQFFGNSHMTLSTIVRNIRRLRVLENLIFPQLPENERSQVNMFEKLLATAGEDPNSELLTKDPFSITAITSSGDTSWGRLGFFYPSHNTEAMNWMVYALEQRAKELGIPGGFEIAVRSSYSTENIISSAFKIANLCDNKKLRGAIILGPSLNVCEPSVRENFYDILTHMLEIMLIRCGIINAESLRLPSTYVKVISELLR